MRGTKPVRYVDVIAERLIKRSGKFRILLFIIMLILFRNLVFCLFFKHLILKSIILGGVAVAYSRVEGVRCYKVYNLPSIEFFLLVNYVLFVLIMLYETYKKIVLQPCPSLPFHNQGYSTALGCVILPPALI